MLSALLSIPAIAASPHKPIGVEIDGKKLDVEAYNVDGRTLVPLRAIFERLQATVKWNSEEFSVTAVKDKTTVYLKINDKTAKINNKDITLDVPPMLIDAKTYVPLRFVSEALGAHVSYDAARQVAIVNTTPGSCSGGQIHTGKIDPAGETWGLCGSPHFVKGDFEIGGLTSPVLTIEAGAVIRFESGASLIVGEEEPGGLVINGTKELPVVLTADSSGPKAGFWKGIRFHELTLRDKAAISGALIEYAGGEKGALYMEAAGQSLEVTVKDTEFKESMLAGIQIVENSRLSDKSGNLKISGTKSGKEGISFPLITDITGSHQLPNGTYTGNEADAIRITGINTYGTLAKSTTWRNVGVPYDIDIIVSVEGPSTPILTIEPGVKMKWAPETYLGIAETNKGGLKAVGTKDKPIVFSGSVEKPGGWMGLIFGSIATSSSIDLQHAVIEHGVYGIYMYDDLGPIVQNTVIRNNEIYGIYMPNYEEGQTDYRTALGNSFSGNGEDQNIE